MKCFVAVVFIMTSYLTFAVCKKRQVLHELSMMSMYVNIGVDRL